MFPQRTVCGLASIALISSCTANLNQTANQDSRSEISEQQAIEIAKSEMLRRRIVIRPGSKPWAAPVASDSGPLYWVLFDPPAEIQEGFQVMVSRKTGRVVDFVDPRRFVTAQTAIEIAKKELSKRGVTLPKNWRISAEHSSIDPEFRAQRPMFAVLFYPPEKGKRDAVYCVFVDKRTGKVYSFDENRGVPIWHGK